MKAAVCLALVLLASIGVADTATARGLDPRPGAQQDSQGQNGFSEVELKAYGRRARSHHTVVVQLSHPHSAPHPTNPDGTPGHHTIPYEFPRTRVHRFCMQDDDGRRHRMVLTNAAGNHVLSVTAGEECVTATIQAGQYTATLHHDGSGTPADVNTVFIRGQVEPVDASVLSSLTGAGPTPRVSAGPSIRAAADGYDAQCYSSKPDFVCCSHVDTWALQASNGFYVTVDNIWNANCGNLDNLSDVHGGPFTCPALLSTKAAPTPSSAVGFTSPGKFELFEVFTCRIQDGTGRQFPKGTMFLSAPSGVFERHPTGGFVFLDWADWADALLYDGFVLVPGAAKAGPIDVVDAGGSSGCAQPLYLTHYDDGRISLSTKITENFWCLGGDFPDGFLADPILENRFLKREGTADDMDLRDTGFFTVNHADFTIVIVTGSCSHCDLGGANLAGYNLAGANLNGANLAGANLSGVNLTGGASLQGATLSLAYMPDADLTGADLTGAHLNNVDFYQITKRPSLNLATLYQTKFANANLIGIDLRGAHLEGADFSGAQMLGALLTGIDHIPGSTNGHVSFVKALLAGADFNNSTFDGGDFTNAIFSTKPGSVDLLVRNSPTTSVTQPYNFVKTVRPLSTTKATVCPSTNSGPCTTDAQWVAKEPPIYEGYNDPTKW